MSLFKNFNAFVEYTKVTVSNWYAIEGMEWFEYYFGSRFCAEYEPKMWIGLFFYMLGIVLFIILSGNEKTNKSMKTNEAMSKELAELKKLFEEGTLTEEEFNTAKKKLLGL